MTASSSAAAGHAAPAHCRAIPSPEPLAATRRHPSRAPRSRTAFPLAARIAAGTLAIMLVTAALPAVSTSLATSAQAEETNAAVALSDSAAVLVTASGRHRFTIDVVDTPATRARGLMERTDIAPDYGMLFDFGTDQPVSFWMKNTPTPLDMIFIRADGTVAGIAADTTPYSLESVDSPAPVRFVLEVVAGTARRIGLVPGSRLEQARVATP